MMFRAIVLASVLCAAGMAWAESEDPSYEPDRFSKRANPKPDEKPAKQKNSDKNQKVQLPPVDAAPRVEVQVAPERKVLLILNGKPIYADDPDAPRILAEIKADAKGPAKADGKSRDKKSTPRENADGVLNPQISVSIDQSTSIPPATGVRTPLPSGPLDDLTADKPGTPTTAQNPTLLEEIPAPAGPLSSRATSCYKLLGELKANIETISRCMDNRGKENALLVHASDEAVKNMTNLAAIWPLREEFIDQCTVVKRDALILNNELNQAPWKWAQVRWSFNALLKSAQPFRGYAKIMAELEQPPRPKLNKRGQIMLDKEGKPLYEDVPDPVADIAAAQQQARLKASRNELEKIKRSQDVRGEVKKNKLDTDLDGN